MVHQPRRASGGRARSDFARHPGKGRENGLFRKMGGKPSTTMLRHRDDRFDAAAKASWCQFLGGGIKEKAPTAEAEAADPTERMPTTSVAATGCASTRGTTSGSSSSSRSLRPTASAGTCSGRSGLR
jgi:hypothetical protein